MVPFKGNQINSATKRFSKFGGWFLLFVWVPIIGDPLTFVAEILRINFLLFLVFVTVGKVSWYFFIYALIS